MSANVAKVSGGPLQSEAKESAFLSLLGRVKPAIERNLEALFEERARALASRGPEVKAIVETAAALTLRGGKRYRAGMLAAAYFAVASRSSSGGAQTGRTGNVSIDNLDDVLLGGGVALELLQSYLLVQDDWMDGDVERRGGPSAHIALAKSLGKDERGAIGAILASDFIWGLAVEALTKLPTSAERKINALSLFTRVHEDVVIGQVLDSVADNADIEVVHDLKTGSYTVRGPVLLGATLAGAEPSDIEGLERYSKPIGVAFQLRDDLIGVFGSEAEAGRPEASDLRSAKNTAVMREANPRLKDAGRAAVDAVWGKPESSLEAIRTAVRAIEATGARAAVEARLFELCGEAETIARSLPYSPETRELLAGGASALRSVPASRPRA